MATRKDLTDKTFNRLTVISYDEDNKKWLCRCECGNEKLVTSNALTSGNTKSCGCLNFENIHAKKRNYKDISGSRYGYLEVLEYVRSGKNGTEWKCYCHKCGSTKIITSSWLKQYKSCGCLAKKAAKSNASALHDEILETQTNPTRLNNPAPNKNNLTTGIKGVCQLSNGKYVAYISFQGTRYTLKRSSDIEECIKARKEAEKMHEDFLKWYYETRKENKK